MKVAEIKKLSRERFDRANETFERATSIEEAAHGEFEPWCEAHLIVKKTQRFRYMKVAKIKSSVAGTFQLANSIEELTAANLSEVHDHDRAAAMWGAAMCKYELAQSKRLLTGSLVLGARRTYCLRRDMPADT